MSGRDVETRDATVTGRARMAKLWLRVVALAFLAILAIAAFLFWRATSIGSLPDIADPFDRAEGVVAIPDDENAFTYYRRAYAAFKADAPRLRSSFYSDPSAIGDRELAILADQREAIDLWLEGTRRDRGRPHSAGGGERRDDPRRQPTASATSWIWPTSRPTASRSGATSPAPGAGSAPASARAGIRE